MRINRLIKKGLVCSGHVQPSMKNVNRIPILPIDISGSYSKVLLILVFVLMLFVGLLHHDVFAARENQNSQDYKIFTPLLYKQFTDAPERVYVLDNHTSYKSSSSGYLHILGEIQNDRHDILYDVAVQANLYNKEKKELASESTFLYLNSLMPGDKTCFDITFTEIPSNWSTYEFDVSSFITGGQRLPDISVTSSIPSSEDDELDIEGTIRNDDNMRVESVRPVGTVYNSSGQVIGCQDTYLDGYYTYLNKGGTGSFTLMYYGRDYSKWDSYRIQVGGILP